MANKRRPSFDPRQGSLCFDLPEPVRREGQLAGLDRRVASAVSRILGDAAREGVSRFAIAGGMSELLDDEVTKLMLDAYASEAREGHNISFGRFLALVAETGAYGVLDALLREIAASIVVGEEIATVELGHVQAQMRDLKAREAALLKVVPAIKHRGRK